MENGSHFRRNRAKAFRNVATQQSCRLQHEGIENILFSKELKLSDFNIMAWQTLLRPPVSDVEPPSVPPTTIKTLTCRNSVASLAVLITSSAPVKSARLVFSNMVLDDSAIPADSFRVRLVGGVYTPEAGLMSDPLYDVDTFGIDKSAAFYVTFNIPHSTRPGLYTGKVTLELDHNPVASNDVEIEVANVDLPSVHDWDFFLNIWMNPGPIARIHNVPVWSDAHFEHLRPYIRDMAKHGQKTAVVPICYKPWIDQTYDPYPSAVTWQRRNGEYSFDFSNIDRYVELYQECGIDRAIHCYSIIQGPGGIDSSIIEYVDLNSGEKKLLETKIGDEAYVQAWSAFFAAFREHLINRGWMYKTYIGFDEKPAEVMDKIFAFLDEHAPDFKTSLAGNIDENLYPRFDDLSFAPSFDEKGIADPVPSERAALGVAELLDPNNICAITHACPEKTLTTFYVCCGPAFPNTFVHSPLVESRMLPFLALQGGYDGFLRWAHTDWSGEPYENVTFAPPGANFPSGDTFFVYPGENGPVSSLRWEQLREGIQDYELATIASANMLTPDEMVDYEQAITLACRNVDGHVKSIGDIEIARRLLIPIAAHANEEID